MGWYEIVKDFAAPSVSLCGVVIAGCFAWAGLRTFDRWKREKIEEKRIDVAIEALAVGFESKLVFDDIRSRFISNNEYANPEFVDEQQLHMEGMSVVLRRVKEHQPFFDKVLTLEPKFVALFGKDKDAIFNSLFSARHKVRVIAVALIEDYQFDPKPNDTGSREQRVRWRKQIFATPGTVDAQDEVGKLLEKFRDEIEMICRPIVDRSFGTPRVGKT